MFDKDEAAALLAGERLMQKWNDTKLGESYSSALDKIRSVLNTREKEYLETLDQHIKVFPYPNEKNITTDRKIFVFLQDAIVRKEVIALEYYSPYRDNITQRDVEPLGLLLRGNHWYLAGWCRLRTDYRMFRVDRIEHYKQSGEYLPDPPKHTLKEFYDESLKKEEKELHEVVVWFNGEIVRYMGDQKYWHGWADEREVDGGLEMTFLCSSLEYFCRWLLIWGNGAIVKKPDQVKNRVQELVEELHEHHSNSSTVI
jgi:predicted DNA-binding transcriptional regulator YafY